MVITITIMSNVGKKKYHKPPVTGNGKHPTYKNGDDWGMCLIFVLPTSYQFQ
jgi:hypothetical protein